MLDFINPRYNIFHNICIASDSYKFSHWLQYPRRRQADGTTRPRVKTVYAYLESRGGKFERTVAFGYQYIVIRHLVGQVVTREKIEVAARLAKKHGVPFNRAGWEHILEKHGGRLPLRIKAVPEGTVLAAHNVLMTVENTDPECFWLTNYVETLLMQSWYPITVASQSRAMAATIAAALERSGDPAGLAFKLQDFGYRGVTCIEQAGIGGAAHLVNFQGTDTVAALELLGAYYGPEQLPPGATDAEMHNLASKRMLCEAQGEDTAAVDAEIVAASVRCVWGAGIDFMPGFSIPASEHSTITSWGGPEHEIEAFRNMLEQYPTGLVACVSDSFDIYRACEKLWGTELHDMIMSRDGTLVIRPDSGDPHEVLPRILTILWEKFGGTVNAKGYKVLDPHVRVIQGDGITADSLVTILNTVMDAGFSADNLVFGSGGGLLQNVTRDTNKFAFKCAAVELEDGTWQDVYKDPVTDHGKRSKRGRMKLVRTHIVLESNPPQDGGECFTTLTEHDGGYEEAKDELRVIFENGELVVYDELATIRERAKLTDSDIAAGAQHAAEIAAKGPEPSVKDLQAEIARLQALLGLAPVNA